MACVWQPYRITSSWATTIITPVPRASGTSTSERGHQGLEAFQVRQSGECFELLQNSTVSVLWSYTTDSGT